MNRCSNCRMIISRLSRKCPNCGERIRGKEQEDPPRFIFMSPTMLMGGLALLLILMISLLYIFFN